MKVLNVVCYFNSTPRRLGLAWEFVFVLVVSDNPMVSKCPNWSLTENSVLSGRLLLLALTDGLAMEVSAA